jgi:DNA-binding MarR family transcriptional regulator
VVQSVAGGRRVLERRTEILARLAAAVDTGRGESRRAADTQSLTAEGLVGATVSILYTRILNDERGSLSGLLNELMSMIVLPYLGASAARREQTHALPRVPRTNAADRSLPGAGVGHEDPLRDIPMRLTYRTARVLEAVSGNPGASNRVIAEGAGIFDQGQVSKLLARLERLGLIKNTSGNNDHKPTGEPNAWRLTPRGEEIERAVRVRPSDSESRHNDKNERSRR